MKESRFFGRALPGVKPEELTGSLIVLEGTDGSGRSTQVALLKEWLESEGFAVQTMGLKRSNLVARNIDELMAKNVVTTMTLTLMYATDLFDQIENVIIPAMHSGFVVLADRYIYTLIARAAVRGIGRPYLDGIYELALRPDLTFWLDIPPKVSFEREFQKAQVISYWESGRDLNLAPDLYESFVRYQELIRAEFGRLVPDHDFIAVDAEQPVPKVNETLRRHIGELLKVRGRRYRPSQALLPLWH